MRVAVNASVFDHRPSGLGIYTRDLVRGLSALHDDLVVFTSRPAELPAGRRIAGFGEPNRGLIGHVWRLTWAQIALPLRARWAGAHVLLNTVPEGPLGARIPQITVVHDVLPLFFPADFPRQQWYVKIFVPAILRASAAVIADSEQTRQDVLDHCGLPADRVTVICPGIDHTRYHAPPGVRELADARFGLRDYALFVGNLRPHKNLLRLVEALQHVPGVMLAVAGYPDPRYTPLVVRRVKALGLGGRVRFLGYVPGEALPILYGAAMVTVVPSLYEGFGLTVLEAMAAGCPVVASSAAGLREATGDAAITVDPYDVDALAGAIRRVASDSTLQAALRERGLAHVRQFRWEATAQKMLDLIHRVAHLTSTTD